MGSISDWLTLLSSNREVLVKWGSNMVICSCDFLFHHVVEKEEHWVQA